MRQNGHFDTTKTWARISADYAKVPIKPVLDGEPLYEDHPLCFRSVDHGYSNAHDIRRFLYWDLFAGTFGHTYGHHSVWQMHDPTRGEGVNLRSIFGMMPLRVPERISAARPRTS
jgi:hypothetical protein